MRIALVAVAAAFVTLLPIPSQAASWRHQDPDRDVYYWGRGPYSAAPANRTADVTGLRVQHSQREVVLTLQLRQARRDGFAVAWYLRTSERPKQYVLQLSRWDADQRYFRLVYDWTERGTFQRVTCAHKTWSVAPRADTYTLTIPRSCLDNPAWVRSGVITGVPGGDEMAYYDDALVDGFATYYQAKISAHRVRRG